MERIVIRAKTLGRNLAPLPRCLLKDLFFLDQRELELRVRGGISQMPFAAFGANPVQQSGHVRIVVNQDVVILVDEALELALFIVTLKLQQGKHGILHD